MIIPINDKIRIESTSHCWALAYRGADDKEGNPVWVNKTWHTSVGQAVTFLYDEQLRASDAEGFAECMAEAKRVLTEITTALTPHFDELGKFEHADKEDET